MSGKFQLLRDEKLRELLSSRGLRVTEQRMVILRELASLGIPVSHPELTERLSWAALDRATIYRNLTSMTEAGLLVRTQLGDNVWRFEMPRAGEDAHSAHPHFVCQHCGTVACLPAKSVVLRGEAAKNPVVEVQLRGCCTDCARETQ